MNNSQLLGKFPYYLILRISGTALPGSLHKFTYSTATPTPMADESMADEFKVEESMADNTIPWHTAYIHKLRNIEIPEKKKRVWHIRRRNIEISEKKKHVEHLGHDGRHRYKYNYI